MKASDTIAAVSAGAAVAALVLSISGSVGRSLAIKRLEQLIAIRKDLRDDDGLVRNRVEAELRHFGDRIGTRVPPVVRRIGWLAVPVAVWYQAGLWDDWVQKETRRARRLGGTVSITWLDGPLRLIEYAALALVILSFLWLLLAPVRRWLNGSATSR